MTKKVKFKQLQGYVDDILARLEILESITDDFNGAIMALEKTTGELTHDLHVRNHLAIQAQSIKPTESEKELKGIIRHLVKKHDIKEGACGTCSKAVKVSEQTDLAARGSQR